MGDRKVLVKRVFFDMNLKWRGRWTNARFEPGDRRRKSLVTAYPKLTT
jgi:hypothetical protein